MSKNKTKKIVILRAIEEITNEFCWWISEELRKNSIDSVWNSDLTVATKDAKKAVKILKKNGVNCYLV